MPETTAHVNWCREERERVRKELAEYESGACVVGEPTIGASGPSQGTITHVTYLKTVIADLTRVIDAFDNPTGRR